MSAVMVRDVQPEDIEALLDIHNHYILHTAVNFDWEPLTLQEFRARVERTCERYPFLVALREGRPVGYACAGPFVGRDAYDWSAELTIYLDPAERGHGTGRALYDSLEQALRAMGICNLYACIGYPEIEDEYLSLDSVRFHERLGFSLVGRHHRCGYKFGRWYDMVWMEKVIAQHGDEMEKPRPYPSIGR